MAPPTQAHAKIWSRMRAADSSVNSSFHIRPFAYSLEHSNFGITLVTNEN